MSRETLETHVFNCSTCGSEFKSRYRSQLGSHRAGRNVFCSKECRSVKDSEMQKKRPGRHQLGPCPTCGKVFRSRLKDKIYCTLECYAKSESLKQRLKEYNDAKAKDWVCLQCGKDAPRRRKFCDDFCRRQFFAERFDRFIANPEEIALPQNYDEFLNRDELPCLVEGCDWCGEGLAYHVNFHHGITPEKFRELVGFNRTTALMGVRARKIRSEKMKRLIDEGVIEAGAFPLEECDRSCRGEMRREGVEHQQKSMIMSGGLERFLKAAAAYVKTDKHRKAASERLKKTIKETPRITLVCIECGQEYETLATYRNRSKYCGRTCGNAYSRKRRKANKLTDSE